MKLAWIVIALLGAGFIGARLAFSKGRLPWWLRDIFLTGWEYILVGAALGPVGFSVIDPAYLETLDPFLALGLGWAGLIFGLQLRWRDVARIDPSMLKLAVGQSLVVWLGLVVFFYEAIGLFAPIPPQEALASAMVAAAAGAISSPTAISLVANSLGRTSARAARTLLMVATLDLAPAVIVVGLTLCFFSVEDGAAFSFQRGMVYLSYSAVTAVAMAAFYRFLGKERLSPEEELTAALGFIALLSGLAFYLRLSPLFLTLLCGAALANTLKPGDNLYKLLYATEKPFYVTLLIISGLLWKETGVTAWVAAGIFVAARIALKTATIDGAIRFMPKGSRLHAGAGLALSSQGALALAIGINHQIAFTGHAANLVFAVIIISTMANEMAAPFLARRYLGRAGK
jgi:hypothetical protein